MSPGVEVLLATHNGERFLREQIDSILAQTYAPVGILARDDGSSDGSAAILEEYAQRFPGRFRMLPGGVATGSAKWNFLRLIEASSAEYLAFSDQDDVWLPEKVAREMVVMQRLVVEHGAEEPLLVFSDLRVVDEDLRTLRASFWRNQQLVPENIHRFARAVAQNVVTGCTALFNRPLARRMRSMPAEAVMHDWWMAMLVSGFGTAAALDEPTMLYRQHAANDTGAVLAARPSGVPRWRYHEKRREQWELAARQAAAFLRLHGAELSVDKRHVLEAFVRCENHPNRVARVSSWLRHRLFLHGGVRPNLAQLWYLWDMKAAKQAGTKKLS